MVHFAYELPSKEILWTMPLEQLKALPYIKIKDEVVLNEQELQRLRERLFGRSSPTSLDANKLRERLEQISSHPSSPPQFYSPKTANGEPASLTHTPSERGLTAEEIEQEEREHLERIEKDYQELVRNGYGLIAPVRPDPGPWAIDQLPHVHFLQIERPCALDEQSLGDHLAVEGERLWRDEIRWQRFRNIQKIARRTTEKFRDYQQWFQKYRQERGLQGPENLQFDWETQSKLDEWKEFQFCEDRQMRKLELLVRYAHDAVESPPKELRRSLLHAQGWGILHPATVTREFCEALLKMVEAALDAQRARLDRIQQEISTLAAAEHVDGEKSAGSMEKLDHLEGIGGTRQEEHVPSPPSHSRRRATSSDGRLENRSGAMSSSNDHLRLARSQSLDDSHLQALITHSSFTPDTVRGSPPDNRRFDWGTRKDTTSITDNQKSVQRAGQTLSKKRAHVDANLDGEDLGLGYAGKRRRINF
ncbi:MAG: hypothetical protein M1816_002654 [Peltula sp. TS41687]|nr:MAG: hypothetical protein M1816_002654 [Peltula sp. TS41687]